MIKVSVQSNISDVIRKLQAQQRQVPYATARALTKTAQDVKDELRKEMNRVFDRPTPYTLNSLRVRPATKQRLEAEVKLKDDTYKGTPADKYLLPQILGGPRRLKRFELALSRVGLLPSGMMVVPGAAAKLDRYGNIRPSQITQILSAVRATSDATQRRRVGKASKYFVGRPGGGKGPLGVWLRDDRGVHPILIYVRSASYKPRFMFRDVATRVAKRNFSAHFEVFLREAMATAR